MGLTSDEKPISYTSDGTTLTAATAVNTVFTLKITDAESGVWTFDLRDQLDHVEPVSGADENTTLQGLGGSSIDLSSVLTATDFDGDVTTGATDGSFIVTVTDDIPSVTLTAVDKATVEGAVEEDGMSLTASGDEGDESEGNRENSEPFDSDEDGETNSDPAAQDSKSLLNLFTSSTTIGADEDGTSSGIEVGLSDDTADIAKLTTLYSTSTTDNLTYAVEKDTDSGTSDTLTATANAGTVFTLVVYHDGTWSFDLDDQLYHVEDGNTEGLELYTGGDPVSVIDFSPILVGSITVEDEDSDQVSKTAYADGGAFTISVKDDVPLADGDIAYAEVWEDALLPDEDESLGIPDDDGEPQSDTDTFTKQQLLDAVSDGADETASFELVDTSGDVTGLKSNNTQVTYSVSGNVLTAVAGANIVFELTLNGDGSLTFDLDDQVDHDWASGDEAVENIDVGQFVVATDTDCDSVSLAGKLLVDVENDVPVINEVSDAFIANEAGLTLTGILDVSDGADEDISASLLGNVDGDGSYTTDIGGKIYQVLESDHTSDSEPVYYMVEQANPEKLYATTDDTLNPAIPANLDEQVFTLALNTATGEYELTMIGTLDATTQFDFPTFKGGAGGSGPGGFIYLNDQGEIFDNLADAQASGTVVATFKATDPVFEVQSSNAQGSLHIGVDNQWVGNDVDEDIILDFGEPDGTEAAMLGKDGVGPDAEIEVGMLVQTPDPIWLNYTVVGTYDGNAFETTVTGEEVENTGHEVSLIITVDDLLDDNAETPGDVLDGYTNGEAIYVTSVTMENTDETDFGDPANVPDDYDYNVFRIGSLGFTSTSTTADVKETFEVDIVDTDGDTDSTTFDVEFDGDNTMVGTDSADVFVGGADAEEISGGGGDDIIHAGDGDDVIDSGEGADEIYGEGGDDTIYAGDDDDVDRVDGGSENTADPGDTAHVDTVDGGAAEDTYTDIETLVDDGTNDV
jgi:T1SS-143 domain-containing protein